MAWFNRHATNRITRPLARWLAGVRCRRAHRPPLGPPIPDAGQRLSPRGSYVIALTYGVESEWVQNVLAAEGCDLVTRARRHRLTTPAILHDESRRLVPPPVRPILRLLRVADFLRLEDAGFPLTQQRARSR
jgi:hypothetical protein